jgi:molecular chaperone DnaK
MYQQAGGAEGAGFDPNAAAGGAQSAPHDDNVVDADFKVDEDK